MSFTSRLSKVAGYLHPSAKWKYGKTRVVYAYDYSAPDTKYQKKFMDSAYKNPVCIIPEPESVEMKTLLSDLTLSDKLIIVSHASSDGLEEIKQNKLVERLLQYGLKEVGVIKFHSCELGQKTWIDNFAKKMMMNGVRFSWVSAPRGYYIYTAFHRWASREGAETYKEQMRTGEYHIVKGNIPRKFNGSRYIAES
ncbi:hypothetical protein LVQ79_01205 [Buttiauxella sp. A2-C1_F]|uniref:hypothetical protein n=1 Tax=Buttiauxella sp. A2-C1_F TaxID=2904526 RepID=UPI001E2FF780|nr:hypothetical protein [Buttiauxella sp. A2-C1_F]MCE0844180.1 hypothetical protein [Buttiauxella sp. A2-C1_F]